MLLCYAPPPARCAEVLPKGRAFVPGCGRGYEAIAFGRSGYDCIGLDLSPSGIEEAKSLLAEEKESMNGKVRAIPT